MPTLEHFPRIVQFWMQMSETLFMGVEETFTDEHFNSLLRVAETRML